MIINCLEIGEFIGEEEVEYELYFNTIKVFNGIAKKEKTWTTFFSRVANKIRYKSTNVQPSPFGWVKLGFGFTLRPFVEPLKDVLIKKGVGQKGAHFIYAKYENNGQWIEEELPTIIEEFTNL